MMANTRILTVTVTYFKKKNIKGQQVPKASVSVLFVEWHIL